MSPEKNARAQTGGPLSEDACLHGSNRWEMPKALLAVVDEHKYIRRLLPLLEKEAGEMKQQQPVDLKCVGEILHYITHFPDQYHHPKEDLIFDRLSGQSAEMAELVELLRREHEKMAVQSKALYQQIKQQQGSCNSVECGRIGEEIEYYIEHLREHMKLEESTLLQPAWRKLSAADWQEIEDAIAAINDPIFGDAVTERYLPLMQRYINEFISITGSGTAPVFLIESLLSRIERGIFIFLDVKHLPQVILKNRIKSLEDRFKRLSYLPKIRSFEDLRTWDTEAKVAKKDDLNELVKDIKQTVASARPAANVDEMQARMNTVVIRTEQDMLAYQQQPYVPSHNPRISWQAVLLNLSARLIFKPRMRSLNFDDPNGQSRFKSKPAKVVPPGTLVTSVEEAALPAVWIVPESQLDSQRTILHVPGGGFFAPATDMHRIMLGKLACQTQSRAMLVSYRLLPEYHFPDGLEDVIAAYKYLLEIGTNPKDIVVTGDSAGGNLALAMLLAVRDEGLPMPAACGLISPCTDMTFTIDSRERNRWSDPLLPSRNNSGVHELYAGDFPLDFPLVSPIFGSFKGLPPMFAFVSSTETLLDDTLVVARKARSEGVDFEVQVWQSLPHAWPLFSFIPESQAAIECLGNFISEHLNKPDWSGSVTP